MAEYIRSTNLVRVILNPLLASTIVVVFWKLALYDNGLFFAKSAETPLLYMIIPPVGFIYVIFASIAVNSAFEQYKAINRSAVRKDIHTYLEHRDQHIPALIYILTAIPSLILVLIALTYQYDDVIAGATTVFAVSLVVVITLFIVYELDNHHRRAHFKSKVPAHWHTTDPGDFFIERSHDKQNRPD